MSPKTPTGKKPGRPAGIAKRTGVANATVGVMRSRGLGDELIEAKLAVTASRRGVGPKKRKTKLAKALEDEALAKADIKVMEQKQKAGELVRAAEVEQATRARAAGERDALLALPARESIGIAVRLGVPESAVRRELTDMIRRFLRERSTQNAPVAA